jgi:drug/metabolite transporter (DMT)-like permease
MGVLGITFAFLNAFFISLTVVIVKYLDNVDPSQMVFIRYFGTILFTIPLLIDSGQNPFISASDLNGSNSVKHDGLKSEEQISLTKARILVLARSFFSALGLYLQYWSVKYLPLGDATVIALMVSIIVCILARIFLGEPFGLFHLATFVLSLMGITLVSKLSFIFG